METREYFEKVMQDYNQTGNGRSLRKYCKDEAVDYNWLMEYKKTYSAIKARTLQSSLSFIFLSPEEEPPKNCFANCRNHDKLYIGNQIFHKQSSD